METISCQQLSQRLKFQPPNSKDRIQGYALVDVLGEEEFMDEHIPGSINIPVGEEARFERFDKNKELIVYCGSPTCSASSDVAEELEHRGYTRVVRYEGGINDWKASGNKLERGDAGIDELKIA